MSILFNGSTANYYVDTTFTGITAAPFSMSCWYKPTNLDANVALVWLGNKDVDGDYWYLGSLTTGGVRFIARDNTSAILDYGTSATAGAWSHFGAVTSGQSSRYAYLNGAQSGENTTPKTPDGSDSFAVGVAGDSSKSNAADGRIAHAAIWNVALEPWEMAALARGVCPADIRPQSLVPGNYFPMTARASGTLSLYGWFGRSPTLADVGSPTFDPDDNPVVFHEDVYSWSKAVATGAPGFETNLSSLTASGQAQASGLISAIDALAKVGFAPALGLVSALDSLAKSGSAASLGFISALDGLTKTGHQTTFPGVAGFETTLDSLTAQGQALATGHGTQLASMTALGHQASLGGVGAFTTNLASMSAEGQVATLGFITALDSMSVLERAHALGFITGVGSETVAGHTQSFGGAGFTTNLGVMSAAGLAAGMTIWELGDVIARAYADLPVFFDSFGFAETVTVGTATVRGIFDDQSAPGGSMEGPLVVLQTGDVTGLGIDQGTEITIRGRSFYAAGVQRDGVGTATVILRELF